MSDFVQLLVAGLGLGASYALIALGFVVIYRSSQIFNFAHGEFLGIGAFTMSSALATGIPWPVALALTLVATGIVAATVERAIIRPMIGRPVFVTVILTIFVGYILRAAITIIWGSELRVMPTPWDAMAQATIFGATVSITTLASILAGAVVLSVFFILLKYSRIGVAMRAANYDQEVALALGIPVGRIFSLSWFVAGGCAALAGVFLSMFPRSLDANIGFVAFLAFPAVIVGGLTSIIGTVIAGLILGIAEVWSQAYIEPLLGTFGHNIHKVFPYIVMILVLIVRPYGLFGRQDVERV